MKRKIGALIAFLTLVITGVDFYLQSGTYFLLDSIRYPIEWGHYWTFLTTRFWELSAYWFLHNFLVALFGYQLFSKFFFVGTLVLSGVLGALFAQRLLKFLQFDEKWSWGVMVSGVLIMMINPVLYERMITQPGVYLAMLMLGYGLYFLLQTLQSPTMKKYSLAGLFFALSVMISSHTIFMMGLIGLLYVCFFWRHLKQFWGLVLMTGIVLMLNANWLIGGFLGNGAVITDAVASFNQANIDSFMTNAIAPFSVELTSALLYGFWGEWARHFYLPDTIGILRFCAGVGVLALAGWGYWLLWQKNKKLTGFLLVLGVLGWIFALGIGSSLFGWFNQWMFDTIPMYIGLREPQKWIVLPLLVVLCGFVLGAGLLYAYIDTLFAELKKSYKQSGFLFFLVLLLFLWVPHLLFAFHGQLQLSDYPEEFVHYRQEFLSQSGSQEKTLILPRHSYVACGWTRGRVVANPFKAYLGEDESLVSADNIEVGMLYTNSTSEQSQAIATFVARNDVNLLKQYGFKKILFLEKCADFQNYEYLRTLTGLQVLFSGDTLTVYRLLD